MAKHPSPNDNRSNVMNPNNPAYAANAANHNAQVNTPQQRSGESTPPPAPTPAANSK